MNTPRPKPSRQAILAAAEEIKSWNPQLWQEWGDVLRKVDELSEDELGERLVLIKTQASVHIVRSGNACDNVDANNIIRYVEAIVCNEGGISVGRPLALPEE